MVGTHLVSTHLLVVVEHVCWWPLLGHLSGFHLLASFQLLGTPQARASITALMSTQGKTEVSNGLGGVLLVGVFQW